MKLCSSCGATAPSGKFCKRCGGPVGEAPPVAAPARSGVRPWLWAAVGLVVTLIIAGGALSLVRSGAGARLGALGAGEDLSSVLALLPSKDSLPAGWSLPAERGGKANPFVASGSQEVAKFLEGFDLAALPVQVAVQTYEGGGRGHEVFLFRCQQPPAADAVADGIAGRDDRAYVLQKGQTVVVVAGGDRRARDVMDSVRDRLVAAGFVLDPRKIQANRRLQKIEEGRQLSQNESVSIGDVRTVISAQAAYQAANAGYYEGRFSCLSSPVGCIPQYPPNAPAFIDAQLSSLVPKSGYAREFHPGVEATERPDHASPSSIMSWAYTAVPVEQGRTGVRSFCGDSSGVVMFCSDGRRPPVANGACVYRAEGCGVLQ